MFWDDLVVELRARAHYTRTLRVLAEIRDAFTELCGGEEADAIRNAINIDFIQKRLEDAGFEWEDCITLGESVMRIIRRAQAPRRDAATVARWDVLHPRLYTADEADRPAVMAEMLEFFVQLVNQMRIDAANSRLRIIAPVIAAHGVEYEQSKFQEKLDAGEISLEETEAWFAAAIDREVAAGTQSPGCTSIVVPHTSAILELITTPDPRIPATLRLDAHRIAQFHAELQDLALRAACYASLAHANQNGPQLAAFAEYIASVEDFNLADMRAQLTASATALVFAVIDRLFEAPQEPVRRLMTTRITTALFARLARNVPVALPAAPFLAPRIEALAAKIDRMASIDRSVHGPRYEAVLARRG